VCSFVNADDLVRAELRSEWQKTPRCWLMTCCPMNKWVLSFPFQLRFLFASYLQITVKVLGIEIRRAEQLNDQKTNDSL
jgi:hypothetical protein